MEKWLQISLILSVFGFFREFRPSEPFVTEFLTSEKWRNITEDQVNFEVYPIGTYATLTLLVFVFLVTDILRQVQFYDVIFLNISERFPFVFQFKLTNFFKKIYFEQIQTDNYSILMCWHNNLVSTPMDNISFCAPNRSSILWILHGS